MNSTPGFREGRSFSDRNILLSEKNLITISGDIVSTAYDGENTDYEDEIRSGTLMGFVTALKAWQPCARTTAVSNTTVTALVVVSARAFKAGDVITVGSTADLTVSAVNYSTNTLTIPSTAVTAGQAVFVQDGSQTCRAILGEFIKMKSLDDGIRRNRQCGKLIIAGFIDDTKILGDLTAVRAASGQYLNHIIWGDQQGYH